MYRSPTTSIRQGLRFQLQLWAHHEQPLAEPHDGMHTGRRRAARELPRSATTRPSKDGTDCSTMTGRTFVEPFDVDRIAVALTAMFEGCSSATRSTPTPSTTSSSRDVAATLATALTVPRGSRCGWRTWPSR